MKFMIDGEEDRESPCRIDNRNRAEVASEVYTTRGVELDEMILFLGRFKHPANRC
jgi:hypothetical protein